MTNKPKTIRIIQSETVAQSWMRDASTYALAVVLIGTGVWLDSNTMQWVGAIVLFMISIQQGAALTKDMTIEQAREYLDELENGHDH